jgi:hypothetical protein
VTIKIWELGGMWGVKNPDIPERFILALPKYFERMRDSFSELAAKEILSCNRALRTLILSRGMLRGTNFDTGQHV